MIKNLLKGAVIGIANIIPIIKATKIEAKISYFNKVIKKENMKNPQKTINVAHLVLATLNWPVR